MNFLQAKKLNAEYEKLKFFKYSTYELARLICLPDKNTNKYSRGVCNIVAGDSAYPGASMLCSSASVRAGAGFTRLYTHWKNRLLGAFIVKSVPVKSFFALTSEVIYKENKSSFVVGPGFTPNNWYEHRLLDKVLSYSGCPVVIDGGALSFVGCDKTYRLIVGRFKAGLKTVITPHFGEALRIARDLNLLDPDQNTDCIEPSRLCFALSYALKCVVVLKGPETYVCDMTNMYYYDLGTSALSKAGTGDVLAGICGATICQNKISIFQASCLSVAIHGLAGNLAQNHLSAVSVSAEDVVRFLPEAYKTLLNTLDS